MASATATPTSDLTFNQFLRMHDLQVDTENLERLGTKLGKSASKTSRVPLGRFKEAVALFSSNGSAPAAPSKATRASRKGAGSTALVPTRTRKSKGAYEPIRLLEHKRLRLEPEDRMILNQLQLVLAGAERRQQLPRVTKLMGRGVAVQDVFFSDRWIQMSLPEFQKRSSEGTLPPLAQQTKKELAEPLGRLSLVNHTCRICNEELEPPYLTGMLDHLLAGNAVLPFRPNDGKALRYAENHKGCVDILTMMSHVEIGLVAVPEDDAKEALRWQRYREQLEANGGRLLTKFMKSEYKPLSGIAAMARVRAIKDHVARQRESLS